VKGYWTTKDGRQVKMSEMSDSHLSNALRYLRSRMCAQSFDTNLRVLELRKEANARGLKWWLDTTPAPNPDDFVGKPLEKRGTEAPATPKLPTRPGPTKAPRVLF
jgi:hypothetical protein